MFNSKKIVECYECKHFFSRENAQIIKGDCVRIYCPEHRKNYQEYERQIDWGNPWGVCRDAYFSRLEVDKDGVPIGYTRTAKKEAPISPAKAPKKRGRPAKKVTTKKK